ncbi:myeloid leukemia factor 1 isoform X5 [Callorhinchus milii]|uniref:myeloid leukemia factor 1 isoform X5 n=1 Tax=Callorhinchus milii TaxID=7868 RepID=UPI0004574D41|nr:myeloid leukemia factor 1 isoform X5 [Callorhinchus milii]|eukprot:gi/632934830/ref/XP_007886597.1/ PREDICTED: myeloid leukemia factor 1 isoform X5 [Callorhinchus milii]
MATPMTVILPQHIISKNSTNSGRDPFRAHQEHMNKMMRTFSDGFQLDQCFGKNRQVEQSCSNNQMPFSDDRRHDLPSNSNGHSFSSSSVKTYTKLGDKPAKLFEASSQTRQAPGGIREIRKAVKDSDTGEEKITIGHHIHDRGHVIERSKNEKSGVSEVNQEFVNVDENEADAFDQEWESGVANWRSSGLFAQPSRTRVNKGLEPGAKREKSLPRRSLQGLNNNTRGNMSEMVQGSACELQNRNTCGKPQRSQCERERGNTRPSC